MKVLFSENKVGKIVNKIFEICFDHFQTRPKILNIFSSIIFDFAISSVEIIKLIFNVVI